MCGFAGLLTTSPMRHGALAGFASRMIAPIAHRGPDDDGIWVDEAAGVALGFRRLAILDLSPLGHQPMASASGRYVIAFNGEIYNFRELRRTLEQHGCVFHSRSDTEVILASFERWGVRAAVRRFIGMFAIAVWDRDARTLSLVRDRLGKKPLYVYREPGLITFGSELKALYEGPSFDRTVDRAALASYFRYLYIAAPKTIFRRAIKVPAAHILTIRSVADGLPDPEPYWSLREVAHDGLAAPHDASDSEAVDAFDALLGDAVERRLCSDVPLGALLSGGIDSSAVVALMQERSRRAVRTFTIGFDDESFDEASHAESVASFLGTDHASLHLSGDEARAMVPRLAEIFDEPFGDPSGLPTLLVSELARRHVTVALSGDGGDELFGGYNRYVYGTQVLPRVQRMPRPVRRLVAAGVASVPAAAWDRLALAAAVPAVNTGRVGERMDKLARLMAAPSVAGMYRSLLSVWQQPERIVIDGGIDEDENQRILDGGPADLLDRMMLADQTTYLPDDLLAKLDRASMAASLEVRAPLLDHRVVEFSWRLPRRLKLRGQTGKWILRQVLYRRVPHELVDRPKMGFSVPVDRWLRGPLRDWAATLLSREALACGGLLAPEPIRAAWLGLQLGRQNAGLALWAVLMFQAWRMRWRV